MTVVWYVGNKRYGKRKPGRGYGAPVVEEGENFQEARPHWEATSEQMPGGA